MSKQIINVGSAALAGDGEGLRTAFIKINNNFNEVYSATNAIATIPTNVSAFNNDVGYLTATATNLTSYATTTYVTNAIAAAGHPKNTLSSGTVELVYTSDNKLTVPDGFNISSVGDVNITSIDTSTVNIFAALHVHSVEAPLTEPIFRILNDGQVRILVPTQDAYAAGVNIIGSTGSNFIPPVNLGVMLQVTGQLNQPSRIYNDGNGTFSAYVGRRYNGIVANPQPLNKDDTIMRISAVGYATNGMPNFGSSRIVFNATEAYTTSSQGGELQFWTNATGTNFLAKDITINSHGITFRDGTSQDTAAIPMSYRAAANGVATLDSNGKVPLNQLAAGAVIYKGAWNAATNQTAVGGYALSNTTPVGLVSGWQYSVSVTGTRDIGNGTDTFVSGDYVTFNGTHWDRIPGALSSVASFNGRIGVITMTTTDVTNVLTPASIPADRIATNGYTFNQGAGISVTNNGAPVGLGGTVTIRNAGVTSIIAGTNISVSANTGSVTISTSISTGPQGPQGNTGAQGPQGTAGPSGPSGARGTAGTNGSAGPSGPSGAQGTAGPSGPSGAQGTAGTNGSNGTNGSTGPSGPSGPRGPSGPQGPEGVQGLTGNQGPTGPQGSQGIQGNAGLTGPSGPQGAQGSQGIQGNAGLTGPSGPQGAQGSQGAQGAASTVSGPSGPQGAQGAQGSAGNNGAAGPSGPQGAQGLQGIQGLTGVDGPSGPRGPSGPQGAASTVSGPQGPSGPAGVNGVTSISTGTGISVTTSTGAVTVSLNTATVMSQAVNLSAMSSILAGTLAMNPTTINKGVVATQTFTITGLTTSHKVIITPAAAMPDKDYFIKGAWASATNTLSVEIYNGSGGNIDAASINVSYIAFV